MASASRRMYCEILLFLLTVVLEVNWLLRLSGEGFLWVLARMYVNTSKYMDIFEEGKDVGVVGLMKGKLWTCKIFPFYFIFLQLSQLFGVWIVNLA